MLPLRQIFVDTETTGLSSKAGHRIVELAAVEVVNGQMTGRKFHTYLNPERSIDVYAERVHGLTAAFLQDKPRFSDVVNEFIEFVRGSECLMHNAPFDSGFIDAELHGINKSERLCTLSKIVCTVDLAKQKYPGESVSLDSLIAKTGNSRRGNHSALQDAELLVNVYHRLLIASAEGKSMSSLTNAGNMLNSSNNAFSSSTAVPNRSGITPERLGMEKTIELTSGRKETFYYRQQHKRIIDHRVVNERRWTKVAGPLLYSVADASGLVRYIGKWESATALYSRWLRHDTIHHQERARNIYLQELDAGRGPLSVWSVSVDEIKGRFPSSAAKMPAKDLAAALEALWIGRWKEQLAWNHRTETVPSGFDDGGFWNS